ncbi:protein kinase [Anabaena sp. FACHB-1237]|uniref:protein kinase domain-containing protein n=1 Tax=Anabaena sp. FACHB-1237 TaxID=2692769 RepID=UPI0016801407|nr:protein kinase [Anabaena sp. FACHB-1237]MBD2139141.1 protein kinase [Anabaena sp. FACHB-1237]
MSYCINPNCQRPDNIGQNLFCLSCGSELLLAGSYRVIKPLGGGGFGKTYEVDDGGIIKVLKVLFNTHPKAVELFRQEAEVLQSLNHPGIPKVESDGYFIYFPRDSKESLHCLVMEKIEGVNLEQYMMQKNHEPIVELAAIKWLKQLAEILQEVHQKNYFHRDIKPPNIMLRPNGQLALIDFGTAREVTQTFMQKVAGQQITGIISQGYTPPEQMNGKAVPQSDFFALGRTFVYLLTGKPPQDFEENPRTGELIWRDSAKDISPRLADLVDYLIAPFPGNRPKNTQEILKKISELNSGLRTSKKSESQSSGSQSSQKHKLIAQLPDEEENNQINQISGNAPFWGRSFAYLIDTIILFSWLMICDYFYQQNQNYSETTFIVFIGGIWLYFAKLESSQMQGTTAKALFQIKIINSQGKKISFWLATWRCIVKMIIFCFSLGLIDLIFALCTQRKRSLTDILSGTVVVKKN